MSSDESERWHIAYVWEGSNISISQLRRRVLCGVKLIQKFDQSSLFSFSSITIATRSFLHFVHYNSEPPKTWTQSQQVKVRYDIVLKMLHRRHKSPQTFSETAQQVKVSLISCPPAITPFSFPPSASSVYFRRRLCLWRRHVSEGGRVGTTKERMRKKERGNRPEKGIQVK